MSCSIGSYGDLSSLCDNVGLDAKKLVSINQVHSSKINTIPFTLTSNANPAKMNANI